MKILVTGSSGFIGFHLVRKLLNAGHKVVGIDNHNDYYDISLKEYRRDKLKNKNFKFYLQDINNIKIKEPSFDLAINLAAQAGVRVKKDKEHLYTHSNIHGFKAFCSFCKLKNISKIIYASSSSVYSDSNSKKFSENRSELKPKSKYGISKLVNENYASKICNESDISIIGLRFFSVYGPYGRPDMAYFLFTEALKNSKIINLNNKGLMARDMTYIDDIINGVEASIKYLFREKKQIKNEIFNLGNNLPITTNNLLRTLSKKINKSYQIKNIHTKNEIQITHADITKAKNLLGYQPEINFNKGIDNFLKWHSEYENL